MSEWLKESVFKTLRGVTAPPRGFKSLPYRCARLVPFCAVNFNDCGAVVKTVCRKRNGFMPLQSLRPAKQAIGEVEELFAQIEVLCKRMGEALLKLPDESGRAVKGELVEGILTWLEGTAPAQNQMHTESPEDEPEDGDDGDDDRPSAREIVWTILDAHPDGITAAEIIHLSRGKFKTKAPNERQRARLISSTLYNMRMQFGTAVRDEDTGKIFLTHKIKK